MSTIRIPSLKASASAPAIKLAGKRRGPKLEPISRLLWDFDDLELVLGICKATLAELVRCGDLPSLTVGKLRKFRPADVAAWCEAGCPHDGYQAAQAKKRSDRMERDE